MLGEKDGLMDGLSGARVALLEGRMSGELAGLVRRHGGEPYAVPAVRETTLDCSEQVAAHADRLSAGQVEIVIFSTGSGAKTLFQEADRLGRLPELLAALQRVTIVCRGPKPAAVLRRHGVTVSLIAPEPHTTTELLAVMADLELTGRDVLLVHYGDRNVALAEALQSRGCRLAELSLYEWQLPEDTAPLQDLIRDLIAGRMDAIAFTSQVQARHLFQVATDLGQVDTLVQALNSRTVVAAVGPTCAAALQSLGVIPDVVPEHPKMGHLVVALANYLEQREHRTPSAG